MVPVQYTDLGQYPSYWTTGRVAGKMVQLTPLGASIPLLQLGKETDGGGASS